MRNFNANPRPRIMLMRNGNIVKDIWQYNIDAIEGNYFIGGGGLFENVYSESIYISAGFFLQEFTNSNEQAQNGSVVDFWVSGAFKQSGVSAQTFNGHIGFDDNGVVGDTMTGMSLSTHYDPQVLYLKGGTYPVIPDSGALHKAGANFENRGFSESYTEYFAKWYPMVNDDRGKVYSYTTMDFDTIISHFDSAPFTGDIVGGALANSGWSSDSVVDIMYAVSLKTRRNTMPSPDFNARFNEFDSGITVDSSVQVYYTSANFFSQCCRPYMDRAWSR